jgi:competence protein ComEA
MLLNREPVRNWFGFTRRERRSTSVLLAIIFIIIAVRYVFPDQSVKIENWGVMLADTGIVHDISDSDISPGINLFTFDPNTASYDTLIRLGLASKEANTIISYRSRGGKFRKPADIRKIYGIDSTKAAKMVSFVEISGSTSAGALSQHPVQGKARLDINTCDSLSLVALPGIGPVLSSRIIKYRNLLGGFAHIEQLKEVYGLPEETYEMIKGRLYADTSGIRKIDVNSAGYIELSRIHYLEKYEVTAILKYIKLSGRANNIDELTGNKILTPAKAEKVQPYLDFR